MKKAKVNLTIDKELNERWIKVSEALKWSRSQMVETFLNEVLPILEKNKDAKVMLGLSLRKVSGAIEDLGKMFEK